ncbi:MAG: PIN domain-containing protein [Gemmatimonadota bacterium]|nr:MAG: PIN domain-containing protein [Gemmatimonadota bacterium]
MTIFVDTSALNAVLDRDDDLHSAARETWVRILSGDDQLLTSNYVILESWALVRNRLGMDAVRALIDEVLPVIRVHWITGEDHVGAVQAVLAGDRRDLSLVDCSSCVVMRRLGLRDAFTFDEDFGEQGFGTLPS